MATGRPIRTSCASPPANIPGKSPSPSPALTDAIAATTLVTRNRTRAPHQTEGDVYSTDEGKVWLEETGWKLVEARPLAGPQSVVIGEAV